MKKSSGFTLIELMIVVAIIGILSAVAFPLYKNFSIQTANKACLAEVKGYVNAAMVELHQQDGNIPPPVLSACKSISAVVDFSTNVKAIPIDPGDAEIICDMSTSGSCSIQLPSS